MEFKDKLQALRRERGLTQEELASALFVSRTAVSKWESGRGYPGIDSLRAIAKYFGVTVDGLIMGEELLSAAQNESAQRARRTRDLVFGLLDCSFILFFFLPLFALRDGGEVRAVSLLGLGSPISPGTAACFVCVVSLILWGVLTLALQRVNDGAWVKIKAPVSLGLGVLAVGALILGLHPYGGVLALAFGGIKALLLLKTPLTRKVSGR